MSQNKITSDDPRLTAYAFDEMTPADRTEFEKLIQQDPAAQQAVDEIRAAGTMLAAALEDEPAFAEPSAVVGPMADKASGKPVTSKPPESNVIRFPQFYYIVSGLAAACFAVFFVYWQNNQSLHEVPKQYTKIDLGGRADAKTGNETVATLDLPVVPEPVPVMAALAPAVGRQESRAVDRSSFTVAQTNEGYAAEDRLSVAETQAQAHAYRTMVAAKAVSGGYGSPSPPPGGMATGDRVFNTEAYGYRKDNAFLGVRENPLSTFSIDVDTASYANLRRFLVKGQRPPPDAVRIEELVNYFPYQYHAPMGDMPFAANLEVASAPWAPEHRLVRIGLKGREVSDAARPAANLVFLLDVSGSMNEPNKLPLVKQSLRLLVDKLRADDHVAIAVYAGASGLALPSTPVSHKAEILDAIERLEASGSTNGAMGIQLAYDIAKANFITGGVNRVILATDGDFNVGVSNEGGLTRLIEAKAKSGVFLSVLGFGMGNYKDSTLEQLADKGNGNYAYIDTLAEAKKTLVEQAGGTLVTIAKGVKIQVEFNPAQVQAYRLIGYENRLLAKEDFNNDKVDAGEIGAGHTVTALYEVVPVGVAMPGPGEGTMAALKYQRPIGGKSFVPESLSGELLTVNIRYKEPAADESRKLEFPLHDSGARFENATEDFKFAAAVAGFGMILRDSPHKGTVTLADISAWGRQGVGSDAGGYRNEFLGLVQKAQALQ